MDKEDNLVSQVDVLLPFSKIQNGNVTIVDTPGISDSIEYRTMLDKYIPKAVAFIIVIDVSRAGGLHGNMSGFELHIFVIVLMRFNGI
uniref:Uncharacterized protein n=1 Tax=Magallana gigas TaxID=29159 RepID=K1QTI7_MAGGI